MRQQLECLQAELCARGGASPNEFQVLGLIHQSSVLIASV